MCERLPLPRDDHLLQVTTTKVLPLQEEDQQQQQQRGWWWRVQQQQHGWWWWWRVQAQKQATKKLRHVYLPNVKTHSCKKRPSVASATSIIARVAECNCDGLQKGRDTMEEHQSTLLSPEA